MTRKKRRPFNTNIVSSNEQHTVSESSINEELPLDSLGVISSGDGLEQVENYNITEIDNSENGTETVDILGNGLILKKVLTQGLGRESRPSHGDIAEISFKAYLEDGTCVEEVNSLSCVVGDGDIIQALDLALPLAERDEFFELVTDPRFAYGTLGREPDIPGGAKLRYEVHLLSTSDPPCYPSMSDAERFQIADQKRERGNYYYRREEYAFAINSYNKALKVITTENTGSAVSSTIFLEDLELKLLNNLAATQLKIQAYEAAVKSCDAVLKRDPRNFKALFRKGKALLEQGEVDDAISFLRLVHEIVPSSSMVASELQRARSLQLREREYWSRAASKMFPRRKESNTKTPVFSQLVLSVIRRWILVVGIFVALVIAVILARNIGFVPDFHLFTK